VASQRHDTIYSRSLSSASPSIAGVARETTAIRGRQSRGFDVRFEQALPGNAAYVFVPALIPVTLKPLSGTWSEAFAADHVHSSYCIYAFIFG